MRQFFVYTLLAITLLGCAMPALAAGSACWYWQDGRGMTKHPDCLEHSGNHALQIKPAVLRRLALEDGYATVFSDEHGWMYVNEDGNVVTEGVMEMDNGADYIKNGFVRYVRNGKCGYASLGKQTTIPAQFDGCLPFSGGKALVCNGCETVSQHEHRVYAGGKSFCIDTKARRVNCRPAQASGRIQ